MALHDILKATSAMAIACDETFTIDLNHYSLPYGKGGTRPTVERLMNIIRDVRNDFPQASTIKAAMNSAYGTKLWRDEKTPPYPGNAADFFAVSIAARETAHAVHECLSMTRKPLSTAKSEPFLCGHLLKQYGQFAWTLEEHYHKQGNTGLIPWDVKNIRHLLDAAQHNYQIYKAFGAYDATQFHAYCILKRDAYTPSDSFVDAMTQYANTRGNFIAGHIHKHVADEAIQAYQIQAFGSRTVEHGAAILSHAITRLDCEHNKPCALLCSIPKTHQKTN